jgi:hypothetical protein
MLSAKRPPLGFVFQEHDPIDEEVVFCELHSGAAIVHHHELGDDPLPLGLLMSAFDGACKAEFRRPLINTKVLREQDHPRVSFW